MENILLRVNTYSWCFTLVKAITSIPLEYMSPHPGQSLANVYDPLGNSIHNPTSAARMASEYYGLRVFKAMIAVHAILQHRQGIRTETTSEEKGREELLFWIETVLHDLKYGHDAKRGRFPGFRSSAVADN